MFSNSVPGSGIELVLLKRVLIVVLGKTNGATLRAVVVQFRFRIFQVRQGIPFLGLVLQWLEAILARDPPVHMRC